VKPTSEPTGPARPRRHRWIGVLFLFGVLCAAPISAQDGRDGTDIWLGMALGFAADTDGQLSDAGLGALQLSVVTAHWAFGIRASVALEVSSGGDEVSDVGLFFGRNWRNEWGHAMLPTGLAATSFGPGENTVGIPLLAEVGLDLFSILGGGLQAFANMNSENPFFGAALFVSIGEVR